MENQNQDKGFTLVELLIVIVILGILATVTVFAVRGITDQGQQSACNSDVKTTQTAVEAYFAQNGGVAIPVSAPAVTGVTGIDPEGTLVEVGLLVESSANYTVVADGTIQYEAQACVDAYNGQTPAPATAATVVGPYLGQI